MSEPGGGRRPGRVVLENVNHPGTTTTAGGAKAGWWSKAVQFDLEAKGVIAREPGKPLRWHRTG
jgi:hypothetical protein